MIITACRPAQAAIATGLRVAIIARTAAFMAEPYEVNEKSS